MVLPIFNTPGEMAAWLSTPPPAEAVAELCERMARYHANFALAEESKNAAREGLPSLHYYGRPGFTDGQERDASLGDKLGKLQRALEKHYHAQFTLGDHATLAQQAFSLQSARRKSYGDMAALNREGLPATFGSQLHFTPDQAEAVRTAELTRAMRPTEATLADSKANGLVQSAIEQLRLELGARQPTAPEKAMGERYRHMQQAASRLLPVIAGGEEAFTPVKLGDHTLLISTQKLPGKTAEQVELPYQKTRPSAPTQYSNLWVYKEKSDLPGIISIPLKEGYVYAVKPPEALERALKGTAQLHFTLKDSKAGVWSATHHGTGPEGEIRLSQPAALGLIYADAQKHLASAPILKSATPEAPRATPAPKPAPAPEVARATPAPALKPAAVPERGFSPPVTPAPSKPAGTPAKSVSAPPPPRERKSLQEVTQGLADTAGISLFPETQQALGALSEVEKNLAANRGKLNDAMRDRAVKALELLKKATLKDEPNHLLRGNPEKVKELVKGYDKRILALEKLDCSNGCTASLPEDCKPAHVAKELVHWMNDGLQTLNRARGQDLSLPEDKRALYARRAQQPPLPAAMVDAAFALHENPGPAALIGGAHNVTGTITAGVVKHPLVSRRVDFP